MSAKKKKEFSKVLWVIAMVNAGIVTLFSMAAMVITGDLTALEVLIPSVFAELGAATGFYYSKAKAENKTSCGSSMDLRCMGSLGRRTSKQFLS